ncbi:MAG: SLC13 family permease [Omnitrophica WOR_2 bacterium]
MTLQIWLLFAVLILASIAFASEKFRPDLIALVVLLILSFSGLVTSQEAFSGLSSQAIILLIAVYIMTGALFRTGVSAEIGRWIIRVAGDHETRLLALVTLSSAATSLLMNNIASGAVLMPAIMDVTRRTHTSPAKLLLPMAFATQLGGMATLFTTSNIVASAILVEAGFPGFRLLDFLPVGGLAALAGILYMVLIGRRFLPSRIPSEELARQEMAQVDLIDFYQIKERLHEARVLPGSPLAGKALEQTGIGSQLGLIVLAIERHGQILQAPSIHETLHPQDVLLISGRDEQITRLAQWGTSVHPAAQPLFRPRAGGMNVLEAILSPHSSLTGSSIKQIQFRQKYHLNVIGLWHNGRTYRTAFSDFPLDNSDVLLIYGPRGNFRLLQNDPDWVVLRVDSDETPQVGKRNLALSLLAITLVVSAMGPWPVNLTMFIGALAMVLTGCLSMDEAYRTIDWRSVFLVGGMLPVGIALTNTGAATLLGNSIRSSVGRFGPIAVAAGLFLVTVLLNQFIPGGSAVPAVIVPIAIAAARSQGSDPRAFALVVAIATGTSMLTPFAHPVNVLVMGPGGYHFKDYLKAGFPLVVITFLVVMLALPVFWKV